MTKYTFWIFAFCLPTVAVLTESLLPEHEIYVIHALSQDAFVIKTWTYRGSALVVKVTKGNKTLFSDFISGVSFKEQKNRLFLKYNNSREEVYLILNNVTRDDEGLYEISSTIAKTADKELDRISETWNVQINVLGSFTNSVSALTIVTPPDRLDENNSDQPSNITLSTTVLSGTAVNRASSQSELSYILTITTVALAIILFFGSLIWNQRKNIKRFKAVKRIVLETMETASSAAFSTLRRCSHTTSRVEIGTSDSNYLRNTVTNQAGRFQDQTPKVSTSGHNTCHSMTQQLDDDYSTFVVTDTILKICETRSGSNRTLLAECHECPGSLIDVCPFPADVFSATEREEHFEREISNANVQCQVIRNTEDTYAEVKKLSSRNNVNARSSCKDGYEMVDFSHFDNPTNGVQDLEFALRREPRTQLLWSYDEEKAFSGRKEEQGEEKP